MLTPAACFRQDGYWGFRSRILNGKLLQARRKGTPFGFSSSLFGTWEQWQASDPPVPSLVLTGLMHLAVEE